MHSLVIPGPAELPQPLKALPESPAQLHRDDLVQRRHDLDITREGDTKGEGGRGRKERPRASLSGACVAGPLLLAYASALHAAERSPAHDHLNHIIAVIGLEDCLVWVLGSLRVIGALLSWPTIRVVARLRRAHRALGGTYWLLIVAHTLTR
jgi:hypothetical protein